MGPLAFAALSSLPSIAGGIAGNSAHRKLGRLYDRTTLEMPNEFNEAESIFGTMANVGLPGAEVMKENVRKTIPSTIGEAMDTVDSSAAMLGLLNKLNADVNENIQGIDIGDANAKMSNMAQLAQFLASKGGVDLNIREYNNAMKIAGEQERMAGLAELFQGIESGIAGGINTFAAGKQLEYTGDYLDMMKGYWGAGGGVGSVPALPAATSIPGPGSISVPGGTTPTIPMRSRFENYNIAEHMGSPAAMDPDMFILTGLSIPEKIRQ